MSPPAQSLELRWNRKTPPVMWIPEAGPSIPLLVSKRAYRKVGEGLSARLSRSRIRENGFKPKEGVFGLDIGTKFSRVRVGSPGRGCPEKL